MRPSAQTRRRSDPGPATRAGYLERVNRAIDHATTHLDEPLKLARLARAAGMSPFHFHRVFQAVVGETPAEFVKRVRLDRALAKMAQPRAPSLTVIAHACGFTSVSDFSRSFKQRHGVSPRAFDLDAWRREHLGALERLTAGAAPRIERLPARRNPDEFRVRVREIPARTVAYIRVDRPYQGSGVVGATERLMRWAERHGAADNQWLGYQWDNPEITPLERCRYHVAVEAPQVVPRGEIGRFRFPAMLVAEIQMRGGIDLELRALTWFYGVWLPRSRYFPDDHPGFEAWIGRPFAHGMEHFELMLQMPVRANP